MLLTFEQIRKLLPQQYPFLMIDKIIHCEPEVSVTGVKNVSGNEYFFQGHFPGQAIMPGALILEAMAQTAIIFFRISNSNDSSQNSIFLFGGVKAKFFKPVVPGDVMSITINPIKIISSGAIVESRASVGNDIVAKAELSFSCQPH